MKSVLTAAVAAASLVSGAFAGRVKKRQAGNLPPVTVSGNAFMAGEDRFFIRGVAYQPGGAADAADPLLDTEALAADIEMFRELGINTIRIYTVDNAGDHEEAMRMLDEAGIYLALDASTPEYSLNRADLESLHWSYNTDYLQHLFATIDEFAGYNNLLLFFSGNEVINARNNTNAAPYIKAVTRDMKRYIGAQADRRIPVGYSAADVKENIYQQAVYFSCGEDDNARSDFFAFNDYAWCDPSSFTISGWDQKVELYSNYSLPIFLSEFGCITNRRDWNEIEALMSENMTAVYSGGLAYEFTIEPNGYGLVELGSNGAVYTFLKMRVLASLLSSAALVAAHGYVSNGTIGGKEYEFYQPYTDPYTSPVPERISRKIPGNGPVEDVTSIDIQCNGYSAGGTNGSEPAALHATVAAGSTVNLAWTLWPDSHVGPTLTYMARCPDTGCNEWQPGSQAVWFKVQEQGRTGTSNTWGASSLMVSGNKGVDYTIPSCLAAGYYLVRHEIIALHAAYQYPGAQFYPGCHQLKVTGGGSTQPSGLVAFPGAYSGDDAGITYDSYKASEYTIPGPAVFSC